MRRSVVAFDAATGALQWIHTEDEGLRAQFAPRVGDGPRRLVLDRRPRGTHLLRHDRLSPEGAQREDGRAHSVVRPERRHRSEEGLRSGSQPLRAATTDALTMADIGLHASPVIGKDTIVVGAAGREGTTPYRLDEVKGYVRAFDVRTGKRLWTFHTIPQKGEFGYDTWEKESAEHTGHVGVWTQMAIDEDLNMVYLPVETPTNDYYGGGRLGNNLFAESLVALDLKTGQRKWHFQIVHHPLWDFDLSSAPDSRRHHGQRPRDQGRGDAEQAVVPVRVRSRHRSAGVADRGASRCREARAWRAVIADAAVPDEAAGLRAAGFHRGGADRFHAGAAREGRARSRRSSCSRSCSIRSCSASRRPVQVAHVHVAALGGTNWPGGSYDPETHTVIASRESAAGRSRAAAGHRSTGFPRPRTSAAMRSPGCATCRATPATVRG